MKSGFWKLGRVFFVVALVVALAVPTVAVASVRNDGGGSEVSIQAPLSGAVFTPMSTTYVYITRTGSKYHRKGCRYLRLSKKRVTLKYARSHGYGRCKICKPPR